jgi:hypothetical protein
MPTTEHIHLPLYTDEETPDLSTTGHYNHAMEIIDANVGELEAEDAELAKGIADERKARTDADTALGSRIDNAETEISANSADLTGIKGLTYGAQHVNFVESSNGEYSSPALEEIAEQISRGLMVLRITSTTPNIGAEDLAKLKANWPNAIVLITDKFKPTTPFGFLYPFYLGTVNSKNGFMFVCPHPFVRADDHKLMLQLVFINVDGQIILDNVQDEESHWENIYHKPFSTIGTGLKVVSDALTVDTAAIPTGITGNTTWGEIEQS